MSIRINVELYAAFSLYDNRYMRAGPYLPNPIRPLGERPPGGPRLGWRTPSPDEHRRRNPGCGHMAKHVLETAYLPLCGMAARGART